METFVQDLRFGLRTLGKNPGFAAVAVLTLALGLGANTAIFGLLYDLLWKPLPYRDAGRLVDLYLTKPGHTDPAGGNGNLPWSYPKYLTLRTASRSFEHAAAYSQFDLNLSSPGGEAAERVSSELVSAEYFPTLGVEAAAGRTFVAEEDREGSRPVILLSRELAERRFGRASALGRTVLLNRIPFTVVGVLPAGFSGLTGTAEAWAPLALAPRLLRPGLLEASGMHWLNVVARPRPGVSVAQAIAAMPAAGAAISAAHPGRLGTGTPWSATGVPLTEDRVDPALKRSVLVLLGAVGCVLLIGCVNVANLLLARAAGRQREVAVRLALGAGRGRLVRQLLTESLLLSGAGGLLGLLFAAGIGQVLPRLAPAALGGDGTSAAALLGGGTGGTHLGVPVLLFALVLAVSTGLLFGAAPALAASRPDLTQRLKEGALGGAGFARLGVGGIRGLLVAGELALAFVLLICASLLLQSFARLRAVSGGFDPEHLLTFQLQPPRSAYAGAEAVAFKERLLARLASLPGVTAVSTDAVPPFDGGGFRTIVTRVDDRSFLHGDGAEIRVHSVAPDHLRAMGIPLVAGRAFLPADRQGAPLVALVNQTAARTLWPGENPVGRRIAVGSDAFTAGKTAEVVGVVGDVRYESLEQPAGLDVYLSFRQDTAAGGTFFLRTAGDPEALAPAVRREVRELDRDLPVFALHPMRDLSREATARSRFGALLLTAFAALALILAGLGIYGVMSYAVSQRTREMGLRMALGARPADILRLVVGQGAVLAAVGIGIGIAFAAVATRFLATLLYGLQATDPATFAAIAVLLGGTGLAAAYLPARQVQGVDPMEVLKQP